MKRLIYLIICLLPLAGIAQTKKSAPKKTTTSTNLKVMGIPITGTISAFQAKLLAKDFKPDKAFNANNREPYRKYYGIFAGEKVDMFVTYDPKTKIVYEVQFRFVLGSTLNTVEEDYVKYAKMVYTIHTKYGKNAKMDNPKSYETTFRISNGNKEIGIIDAELEIVKDCIVNDFTITYTDKANYLKFEKNNSNTLNDDV